MARTKAEAIRKLNLCKIALRTSARPQALRKYAQNARIPYPHTVPPRPPTPPREATPPPPKKKVYPTIAQLYRKTRPKKMKIVYFVKKVKKVTLPRKGRCATKRKEWVPVKGHRRRVNKCVTRRHTGTIPAHWYKSSVKRRKGG